MRDLGTVGSFFDSIIFDEEHNVRILDNLTGAVLLETSKYKDLFLNGMAQRIVQSISCDWNNKMYELWI